LAVTAMLRSFRVSNHRSIRDEQELILLPAYDQKAPVVPVTAVFGANASGKSNLLDALGWMRSAVLHSYRLWEAEAGIPRSPFRLDLEAAAAPSSFAVDLTLDGVPYTYGFSLDDDVVAEEWLHAYPHNRERVIFERAGRHVELGSTVPERRSRADVLASLMRDNALLLSTAVQAGQEEVLPVHRWFRDSLRLGGGPAWQVGSGVTVDVVAEAIERFPSFAELVRVADLGISAVTVDERVEHPSAPELDRATHLEQRVAELESQRRPRSLIDRYKRDIQQLRALKTTKELYFMHGPGKVPLGPHDQSAGTMAWTGMLAAALRALEDGALMVVDEVDASLHPRLTARLIEMFQSAATNTRGAQLLFTTHDATLLGTSLGDEVLRRDEIWFVEKRDGASRLYPLSDFHPRKGENRERRYLAGSYGAVPVIFSDSLVESMVESRAEPVDGSA
jgi:hypothetical protein